MIPPSDADDLRERIDAALLTFLDEQAERLAPLGPDAAELVELARTAVAGGKKLRASFCYWAARAVSGDEIADEVLVRASASLELLHASALVHDDLMDDSDTRRGRPAAHREFATRNSDRAWPGDAEQYGAAAAILLGDLLLTWSDELLRRCGLPLPRVAPALDVLDRCRSEVIAGQFLDVSVQARGRADVDAAMGVLRYKSAKYSVERPLHLGAALAGADQQLLEKFSAFGLPLGEAFQLRDDLLGVFGDPHVTGKPAGDDLVEGKRTVLVALALDAAPSEDAAFLDRSLGTDLGPDDVDRLRTIIDGSGARGQVEAVIGELAERSLRALEALPVAEEARDVLRRLALAATHRSV